jgi:hypothetical protein
LLVLLGRYALHVNTLHSSIDSTYDGSVFIEFYGNFLSQNLFAGMKEENFHHMNIP